jgi:hypothetical protein
LLLELCGLRRGDEAKIMFGVLKVIFGGDRIAAGMSVARELQVFFRDMVGVAANLNIGPVRLVGSR